jgi:hypothetical protein
MKNKFERSNGTVFKSRDFEQKKEKYRKLKGPNVQGVYHTSEIPTKGSY